MTSLRAGPAGRIVPSPETRVNHRPGLTATCHRAYNTRGRRGRIRGPRTSAQTVTLFQTMSTRPERKARSTRAAAAVAAFAISLCLFYAHSAARAGAAASLPHWQQGKIEILLFAAAIWAAILGALVTASCLSGRPATKLDQRRGASGRPGAPGSVILALLVICYVVAYGWLSIERHRRFNSTGYDLAIKEQVVWNTAHGRFFASSVEVDNAFEDHFQPLIAAFVLPYMLVPRPELLLVVQTVGLALGALPLYRLARRGLESEALGLAFSAAYLLCPALGFVNRFDFHPEALAIPAFIAAFEALDRDDLRSTSMWLLVALLGKENLGFSVATFALYAVLVRRKTRFGLGWLAIGLTVSVVVSFCLIPALRGGPSDTAARYAWLGQNPLEMLLTIVSHPAPVWRKVANSVTALYVLQLLLPTALLALLGLPELLIAVPGLALNLLAEHFCQPTIYCQYTVPLVPFVLIAATTGLARLRGLLPRGWGSYVVASAVLALATLAFLVDNPFAESQQLPGALAELTNSEAVYRALPHVPAQATLVTTNAYAPHLAQREGLYIIGIPAQREPPLDPEAIFINLYDQRYMTCQQYRDYFEGLDTTRYGLVFRDSGVVVICRNGGSIEAFRDFVENWTDCAG